MTDAVEQIKSKIDIIDLISRYVPTLKKAGSSWVGLCPFHKEKTPSFHVNQQDQYFKCFGCGASGDIFTFYQDIEKVDFKEALSQLAQEAGVEISNSSTDKQSKKIRDRILEANLLTAKFYNYILNTHKLGEAGRQYAVKRGLTGEIISKFSIGYAPDTRHSLMNFLLSKNFKIQELVDFGLLVERNGDYIDKFRHRLMQPIFSIRGQVIGFSGRYIGQNSTAPKYLNSPETVVYKKNETLYSLYHALDYIKQTQEVIIVEGNIDILSSHRVGVGNIVAPLGTSFTEQQAKLLKRYTDRILICFDSDSAGVKALIRSIDICERHSLSHRVIDLGEMQDADQLIMTSNDPQKQWVEAVTNNVDTINYLLQKFKTKLNLNLVEDKLIYKKSAFEVLKFIRNDISFFHHCRQLSLELEVPESSIVDELQSLRQSMMKKSPDSIEINIDINSDHSNNEVDDKANPIRHIDFSDYYYFLQLLINTIERPDLGYPETGFFEHEFFQKLLNFCINTFDNLDFSEFEKSLNKDDEKAMLKVFLEFNNIPNYDNIDREFNRMNKFFWKKYINKRLLQLRNIDEDGSEEASIERQKLIKLKKKFD
jgi:DNA primase